MNKSLNKDISVQRAKYAIQSSTDVQTSEDLLDFLENLKVLADVEAVLAAAERKQDVTSKQHMLALAYLAASLIHRKAQQLGVVQKMTMEEFLNYEEVDTDTYLIKVLHQKTVALCGPANVIVS